MRRVSLKKIVLRYERDRSQLVPLLQEAQDLFGSLPEEAVTTIARHLRVSESEVFGVASFFAQFKFEKPARHTIKVCLGTACHVRGGELLLRSLEEELGVKEGHSTPDGRFSLERVACFGCCALAPVVVIDRDVHGQVTQSKLRRLLRKYK